jgi:hypothetical protein
MKALESNAEGEGDWLYTGWSSGNGNPVAAAAAAEVAALPPPGEPAAADACALPEEPSPRSDNTLDTLFAGGPKPGAGADAASNAERSQPGEAWPGQPAPRNRQQVLLMEQERLRVELAELEQQQLLAADARVTVDTAAQRRPSSASPTRPAPAPAPAPGEVLAPTQVSEPNAADFRPSQLQRLCR